METWEVDFEWLKVRHLVKDAMQREALPDMNAILFLVGVQELGRWKKAFTKEEKQDLMHIAICSLMSEDGFYEFQGRDADGWPHFKQLRKIDIKGVKAQQDLLKINIIKYFRRWEAENKVK